MIRRLFGSSGLASTSTKAIISRQIAVAHMSSPAQLEPALGPAVLRAALSPIASPTVADAISGSKSLKTPKNRTSAVAHWLEDIEVAGDHPIPKHPVFHHDKCRRLSARFALDASHITSADLGALAKAALTYLGDNSS